MVAKCANPSCPALFRYLHEGKLFRADVHIENSARQSQRKTEYVWLCGRCAREMAPKIEVSGNAVIVRLFTTGRSPSLAPT